VGGGRASYSRRQEAQAAASTVFTHVENTAPRRFSNRYFVSAGRHSKQARPGTSSLFFLEAGAEKYYAPFMPEDAFPALTRSFMWLGSTPGQQGY